MLPRALFFSPHPLDALFETGAVFIIGNVLVISFSALRKERDYRTQLEQAKSRLENSIQRVRENEKRLSSLHQISSTISQSLHLNDVLYSAISNVVDVMQVDVGWIFLLDEEAGELKLAVYQGIPKEFADGIDKLRVGEGLSGRVAHSGEPLFIEDVSHDPRLTREVVSRYGLQSMLIVPLRSKGKVNGTLCVAMRNRRYFHQQEIETLMAIGNQIGVAVENARLYQQQEEIVKRLQVMQENLRFQLRQITRAQEEERKRISRELHDETIQELVVLSRHIDTLASNKELSESHRLRLEEILSKIDSIIRGVRRLSQDLRPAALDRLGLIPALEWLASDIGNYSGLEIKVSVLGVQRRFPEEVELILFRIAQEALRNIWRHARATKAEIIVEFQEDKTRLVIRDNGIGFKLPDNMADLARDGKLGLAGMQERAGLIGASLSVESQLGKGTSIMVEVKVSKQYQV